MTPTCKISTIKQALGHFPTILLKILCEGTVSHKAFLAFQGEIFMNRHGLLGAPIEKQTFRG